MEQQSNNRTPLVSLCATFFNAERYIHRFLESGLNQTYRNIELILVDDQSTDKSEQVIREYAARDARVVYHKNATRVGLAESELMMFKLARGEFCMMVGADDWLSRGCIEAGVKTFSMHPEAAGVIPQGLWFAESPDGIFALGDQRFDDHLPPRAYSDHWFMAHLYKPRQLYMSALALVRSKDYVVAMQYYLDNYYYNLPESASPELRHFSKMAFGMDSVVFPEMLTRYKTVVFDSAMRYIKIGLPEGQANNLDLFHKSLGEVFKALWYQLRMLTAVYKQKWPQYFRGMKIFKGAEAILTVCSGFVRARFRFSFLRVGEHKQFVHDFFAQFSFFEIIVLFFYAGVMIFLRPIFFFKRKFVQKQKVDRDLGEIFNRENFFDKERRFSSN